MLFYTGLKIQFDRPNYFFMEGVVPVQEIKVRIKKTQHPFTLILHAVSLMDALDTFHVDNFIDDPPHLEVEKATSGKM